MVANLPKAIRKNVASTQFYHVPNAFSSSFQRIALEPVKKPKKRQDMYGSTVNSFGMFSSEYSAGAQVYIDRNDDMIRDLVSVISTGNESEKVYALAVATELITKPIKIVKRRLF